MGGGGCGTQRAGRCCIGNRGVCFAPTNPSVSTDVPAGPPAARSGLLVLLVVEAAVVQLLCISYCCWLALRCERGRRCRLLVGLGLPGPILRVMASRPLTVVEVRARGGALGGGGVLAGAEPGAVLCGLYTTCSPEGFQAAQKEAPDGPQRRRAL